MNLTSDTIAAISTPIGRGGIGIVRISGNRAETVAMRIFRPKRAKFPLESHKLTLGVVVDPDTGQALDEALCVIMRGPASYTREDVAEIHCHGGPAATSLVLKAVLQAGAVLAEPGEFTKRAFLAGRIDLSQAEAVTEMIEASGESEVRLAARQLTGLIRREVEGILDVLVELAAHLEAALDFPEDDIEIVDRNAWTTRMESEVEARVLGLLERYAQGRVFREGLRIAIVGRPNVGKSSLLNALIGEDRAIVTSAAGTTRDVVDMEAVIGGAPVRLLDTAGLQTRPADEAEELGQRRARAELARADLALMVVDGSQALREEDFLILRDCPEGHTVVVVNKSDLAQALPFEALRGRFGGAAVVPVSAKTGDGLAPLEESIKRIVFGGLPGKGEFPDSAPNLRHKTALEAALPAVRRAAAGLHGRLPWEIVAVEVGLAMEELGKIIGRTGGDEVLDAVFSRFCLGK